MSPEQRMRDSDADLAKLQAFNVDRIKKGAEQCSTAELNVLIAGAGLSSRRVSGALAASRKGQADAAKAATVVSVDPLVANENDIEANPEMEMDDDTGRTPERVEQVRAEIRRRLGVGEVARESKSLDHRSALDAGGALPGGVAGAGTASETAV